MKIFVSILGLLSFLLAIIFAGMYSQTAEQLHHWQATVEQRDQMIQQLQAQIQKSPEAMAPLPERKNSRIPPEGHESGDEKEDPKQIPTPSPLPPVYISYTEWKRYRDTYRQKKEQETQLQVEEWWEQTKQQIHNRTTGRRVRSDGFVSNVKKRGNGDILVTIDIDASQEMSVSEFVLHLADGQAEKARHLRQGQSLAFVGDLDSIAYFLGSLTVKFTNVEL